MGTIVYECGCSITRSMFGEREILWVHTCGGHSSLLQQELKALAEKVANIQPAKPK